jgi:predicted metal-dependent hydrolase
VLDSDQWREAVDLLEAGEFWAAHEALEGSWLEAEGLDREFLGGVILLAAALHKARAQASARGALRNYAKALRHLALVPDEYRGIEVRELEARVHRAMRDPAMPVRVPLALSTSQDRVHATGVRA